MDIVAFVGLDIETIAYLPVKELTADERGLIQLIAFRSPNEIYKERKYITESRANPRGNRIGTVIPTTMRYIHQHPIASALLSLQTKTAEVSGTAKVEAVKECLVTGS